MPDAVVGLAFRVVIAFDVQHFVAAGQVEGRSVEGGLDLMHDFRSGVVMIVKNLDPQADGVDGRAVALVSFGLVAFLGYNGEGARGSKLNPVYTRGQAAGR